MTTLPFWQRWSVHAVASLVIGIAGAGLTYVLDLTPALTNSLTVAVSSWVIAMVFSIAYSLHAARVEWRAAMAVREALDAGESLLLEFQSRLREIALRPLNGRPNHVFIDYCHRSLKDALAVATQAAQSGELTVRDHHFDTVDKVMAAFDGCKDRTFCCVWLIDDGELFDDSWRHYMACLVELGGKSRRTQRIQVRILFVVRDLSDDVMLRRPAVAAVFGFVATAKGFACRVVARDCYEVHRQDAGLSNECLDFGVYGDHLLFRTTQYEPTNEGTFSVDPTAIQKYRRMHDLAMEAPQARDLPANLPENVSLEAFLNCDAQEAQPQGAQPHLAAE